MADLRSAVGGEDVEAIRTRTEALAQASMKLGEAMYRSQQAEQQQGQGPGDGGAGGGTRDESVVDADFEEVDDDRKKSA